MKYCVLLFRNVGYQMPRGFMRFVQNVLRNELLLVKIGRQSLTVSCYLKTIIGILLIWVLTTGRLNWHRMQISKMANDKYTNIKIFQCFRVF